MTSGIPAILANINVSDSSLGATQNAVRALTATSPPAASTFPEDTVQLSSSAQQYLQASQSSATQTRDMVEQLVQAAAAGDHGALSLLTVV